MSMAAFRAACKTHIPSSPVSFLRRRFPLAVPAVWLLTSFTLGVGLTALHPSFPFTTGSNIASRTAPRALHSSGMEGNGNIVPSIVVYVTVPNKEAGKKLAESIVREKLAACVNRVPGIESIYWWQGEIQSDAEELLIIKTRESLLDALTAHIKANHEYDVPEVIALPIQGGNAQYLEWLKNSTRDP
ncbi:protein CutA 1, chloroplastic isoform X2 [Nymphaea colorata]|uniref:protein CutA 1, chloroplastic isoform X2 n=1 Tax=Nymphaea colorata TaxID=210225 RepID=UPI00129D3F88|nr:protein CutA 1, chloroplastic isoform X2 [Nymphaea colorata]